MGINYNSKIVTDGLVLHLDAANYKSFKGEPTTNLISDPFALSGNPGSFSWGGLEATCTRTNILPNAQMSSISPYWMKIELTNTSGTARISTISLSGLTVGIDYCFSAYVYSSDSRITSVRLGTHNTGVSTDQSKTEYTASDIGSIKRIQTVFRSVSGGQLEVLQMSPSNVSGMTFYITGVQIEQKSYPTPVVNGTRGATVETGGGWADLSGNNNGTLVNNPTYSSSNNGAIVFDGTNDYILIGSNKYQYQNNFSIEAIARFTSTPNNAGICPARHPIIYNHDYGYNFWIESSGLATFAIYNTFNDAKFLRSLSSVVGQNYFHMVGTKSDTLVSLYINGELNSFDNLTTNAVYYYPSLPQFVVGGYANCGGQKYYSTGNISQIKIYNRLLSGSEIKQNFNAARGRYGI